MAFFKGYPVANWWQRYVGQFRKQEKPPVQTEPFKSDMIGFNTRFSFFEIEQKLTFGRPLTDDERQFYNYIKSFDRK